MPKKRLLWIAFAVLASVMAVVQFIPSAPVIVPAALPAAERADHRLLNFEGIDNFRDLGGYTTSDGRSVKWGKLYRSGTFAHASRADQGVLAELGLTTLVDFRSAAEKEGEPNQLPQPPPFEVVTIPTLDGGDNSVAEEIIARLESGDFSGFEPDSFMITANRQFASTFTPNYREFMQVILSAGGEPVVWHCSAGKDRTGFAAAILLRTLGVPMDTVMLDYLASLEPAQAARSREMTLLRLFKGDEIADKLSVLLGVDRTWLEAAFEQIDSDWGSFDNYVSNALELTPEDVELLRSRLLE